MSRSGTTLTRPDPTTPGRPDRRISARLFDAYYEVGGPANHPGPFTDQLRHAESDLRCYLSWFAERVLDPVAARRPYLELYIQWMQEIRYFKPPIVSRRFSVTAGFYKTCVIDGLLEHSAAAVLEPSEGSGGTLRVLVQPTSPGHRGVLRRKPRSLIGQAW